MTRRHLHRLERAVMGGWWRAGRACVRPLNLIVRSQKCEYHFVDSTVIGRCGPGSFCAVCDLIEVIAVAHHRRRPGYWARR
jgi:hypothetical protein